MQGDFFEVIPSDYSTQLTYLLRYPSPPPRLSTSDEDNSLHHATLLLRQALNLQMAPTPATGASIIVENRNLLNIPLEIPDSPSSPTRRRPGHNPRDKSISEGRPGDTGGHKLYREGPSQQLTNLPEMIARGLLDKGESLGINKTLMSAVSEFRVSFYA
jgi:TBC1 domain family protein 5